VSVPSGEFAGQAIRGLNHHCLPPNFVVFFVAFAVKPSLLSRENPLITRRVGQVARPGYMIPLG